MDIFLKQGYREPTGKNSTSGGIEFKRVYVVTNPDTTDDMEYRIMNHPIIPKLGDSYSADNNLKVTDISISMAEDLNYLQWEVEVTYKIPDDDSGGAQEGFQRNLQVSGRAQQYETPLEAGYDTNNNQYKDDGTIIIPVVSTSNEPLLVTKYDANVILDINQNVSRFDFDWIREFKNSTNAKAGKIVGIDVKKDQARILDISASSQIDNTGVTYYAMTISIEVTDSDFLIKPMNKGFMKKADSADNTAREYILKSDIGIAESGTDIGNERIDEPARLTLNNEPIPANTKGGYYIPFKAYPSLNWNVLDIPSSQP